MPCTNEVRDRAGQGRVHPRVGLSKAAVPVWFALRGSIILLCSAACIPAAEDGSPARQVDRAAIRRQVMLEGTARGTLGFWPPAQFEMVPLPCPMAFLFPGQWGVGSESPSAQHTCIVFPSTVHNHLTGGHSAAPLADDPDCRHGIDFLLPLRRAEL